MLSAAFESALQFKKKERNKNSALFFLLLQLNQLCFGFLTTVNLTTVV